MLVWTSGASIRLRLSKNYCDWTSSIRLGKWITWCVWWQYNLFYWQKNCVDVWPQQSALAVITALCAGWQEELIRLFAQPHSMSPNTPLPVPGQQCPRIVCSRCDTPARWSCVDGIKSTRLRIQWVFARDAALDTCREHTECDFVCFLEDTANLNLSCLYSGAARRSECNWRIQNLKCPHQTPPPNDMRPANAHQRPRTLVLQKSIWWLSAVFVSSPR